MGIEQEKKVVDPRMHSAEHILTGTLMKFFGWGRPFTTHIEKKKSKADYRFDRDLTEEEVKRVQDAVNSVAQANLPVREEFLNRAAAENQFDLSRLPEEFGDNVRIIRVGDYDACPCIGPHVAATKEIGHFRIISTSFENGALRVRFKLDPPV